ncbi:hypothetical protein NJ76_16155 [Rhodococcus sp. IITR03]|nr:hypothetical protein NJ76_16155 [Rhodococcus sp. IITR03]
MTSFDGDGPPHGSVLGFDRGQVGLPFVARPDCSEPDIAEVIDSGGVVMRHQRIRGDEVAALYHVVGVQRPPCDRLCRKGVPQLAVDPTVVLAGPEDHDPTHCCEHGRKTGRAGTIGHCRRRLRSAGDHAADAG